ncbi:MAG: hypothetical protein IKL06_02380, partial [Lachnospiraceae bacterium]|nr:hypothetical protein [Lachnospiraceae bacterium]
MLFLMVAVLAGSKLYTGFKAKQLAKEAAENEEETVLNSQALAKMKSVEELIQTYYYLDETETERLEEGVFDGMMGALEDPYSVYYTQEELQEQLADNEGVFFGIGAYISIDKVSGFPFVSGLIEGAPAEGAGLRP